MNTYTRRLALAAVLALVGVGLFAAGAHAQGPRVVSGRAFPVVQNIYQPFVPTLLQQSALRQWAHDMRVVGRTYRQFPPWVFGYNPYPQVVNYGPVYPYPTPIYSGYYNPWYYYATSGYSPYLPPNPYGYTANPYAGYTLP